MNFNAEETCKYFITDATLENECHPKKGYSDFFGKCLNCLLWSQYYKSMFLHELHFHISDVNTIRDFTKWGRHDPSVPNVDDVYIVKPSFGFIFLILIEFVVLPCCL